MEVLQLQHILVVTSNSNVFKTVTKINHPHSSLSFLDSFPVERHFSRISCCCIYHCFASKLVDLLSSSPLDPRKPRSVWFL